MIFSRRVNATLTFLLILLNIILRLQPIKNEMGIDSFIMHIMINSLTEYGYAKWILNPLSFAGLYPYSYSSSTLFFLSAIQQATNLEMNSIILIYTISLAIFSIFSMYLMMGAFTDNDLFKHIAAFLFSTSPGIITYTTQTIGTRPLVIVFAPLMIHILLNSWRSDKKIMLTFTLILFMFMTHHILYFLLPIVGVILIFESLCKLRMQKFIRNVTGRYTNIMPTLIPVVLFMLSFSIPFVFKKFLEYGSRYNLSIIEYIRYVGPLIVYSISGIFYLTLKQRKSFNEWILLLSTLFITAFIYIPTYMKWLIPVLFVPLAVIGIKNTLKGLDKKRIINVLIVILMINVLFTGFYQFIHVYEEDKHNGRFIEESTYNTGIWMKEFTTGNAISNDRLLSFRIFAVSDSTHFLVPFTTIDAIYGFVETDISFFKRHPISSEEFWYDGYYSDIDPGEDVWYRVQQLLISPNEFSIGYVVENMKGNGNIIWNHGSSSSSKVIELAHKEDLVYDVGNIKVWKLFD